MLDEARVRCGSRRTRADAPHRVTFGDPLYLSLLTCQMGQRRCPPHPMAGAMVNGNTSSSPTQREWGRQKRRKREGRWGEVSAGWTDAGAELRLGAGGLPGKGDIHAVWSAALGKRRHVWILVHALSFIFLWEFMEVITSCFLSSL